MCVEVHGPRNAVWKEVLYVGFVSLAYFSPIFGKDVPMSMVDGTIYCDHLLFVKPCFTLPLPILSVPFQSTCTVGLKVFALSFLGFRV